MFLICLLQGRYKRPHKHSLIWKRRCMITNFTFISLAVYFYMRHNSMCEPYGKFCSCSNKTVRNLFIL